MPTPFQTAMMVVGSLILLLGLAIYLTEAPRRARWVPSEMRSLRSARRRLVMTTFVVAILAAIPLAIASLSLAVVALVLGLSITGALLFSRKGVRVLLWRDTESPVHRGGDTSVHIGSITSAIIVAKIDVSDILDPVTGTGFDDGELAWRCTNCQMFYHDQTYHFLNEQNSSRCVGCGQSRLESSRMGTIEAVPSTPRRPVSGFEFDSRLGFRRGPRQQVVFEPPVVRLHEVAQYIGHVIYFQGKVVEVQKSRSTETYCVKFQRGPWPRVFKLVIFPNYVGNFRFGGQTIKDYEHKTIRVRGLIQDHPEWGLEIIVYNENAIRVID